MNITHRKEETITESAHNHNNSQVLVHFVNQEGVNDDEFVREEIKEDEGSILAT